MQTNDDRQLVVTSDQDIPFGRMVVLAIKWALAAIPALVMLAFLWACVTFAISRLADGPADGELGVARPVITE